MAPQKIRPILLIKVFGVTKIECVDFENIGNNQRTISDLEVPKAEGHFSSKIMDVFGGEIDLTHKDGYKVLCYDTDGKEIALTGR